MREVVIVALCCCAVFCGPLYSFSALAVDFGLADFFPWGLVEEVLDAILDHPTTGHVTVASLRAAGGFLPLITPRRLCRSNVRLAVWQDRVLLLAGGQARVTTAAGA